VIRSLIAVPVLLLALWMVVAPAAPAAPEEVFRFDEQVTESSGLVDLGSRVLTVNDSGDDAVVYVVDPRTGATVGRTTYAEEAIDVEAVTLGADGDVWVGDIGDNAGTRTGVVVHRIERPGDGDRRVEAATYDLVYRGGARDAETLLVSPRGRVHVVSKGFLGGQVWQAPVALREDGPNVLTPVGDVGGLVTDGAWFPDGRHVVLRDYDSAVVYDVSGEAWRRVGSVRLPDQGQGEGVAVRRDGSLLISSEGERQPVVQVPLPRRLTQQVEPARDEEGAGDESADDGLGAGLGGLVEGGSGPRRVIGAVIAVVVLLALGRRFLRLRQRP
jgi:hypothetical protein